MGMYSGKTFELLPTDAVTPTTLLITPIIVSWEYFKPFAEINDTDVEKYLVNRYIKQGRLRIEKIKNTLKTFSTPIWTLDDIIIFTSLVVCADPDILEDDTMSMAKELITLADKYMVIRDTEDRSQIPTKDFIKAAVKEAIDNHEDEIRDLMNREFENDNRS